jgi:hypothetical protein
VKKKAFVIGFVATAIAIASAKYISKRSLDQELARLYDELS